ncbi:hypothetical protein JOD47_003476 [Arthrobacter tumbae]|nr:hypothetical protein [Arthrobacter tumbae]
MTVASRTVADWSLLSGPALPRCRGRPATGSLVHGRAATTPRAQRASLPTAPREHRLRAGTAPYRLGPDSRSSLSIAKRNGTVRSWCSSRTGRYTNLSVSQSVTSPADRPGSIVLAHPRVAPRAVRTRTRARATSRRPTWCSVMFLVLRRRHGES